jgi:hypothetical protein
MAYSYDFLMRRKAQAVSHRLVAWTNSNLGSASLGGSAPTDFQICKEARGQIQSPWLGNKVDSSIGLRSTLACSVFHNVLESTLEWTYCEVIFNSGIVSHTPFFSLDLASAIVDEGMELLNYSVQKIIIINVYLKRIALGHQTFEYTKTRIIQYPCWF